MEVRRGQEDQFPLRQPSARCVIRKETFGSTNANA